MPPLLEVEGIGKSFDGLQALLDVSFQIEKGETVGLIGPNGSGKSTMFNIITGTFPPSRGRVRFDGRDITRLSAHQVAERGIARTFQSVRPFMNLTVLQSVQVASLYGSHSNETRNHKLIDSAINALELVNLADKADLPAHKLNVMQRKWLEIARALATRPQLILLDEFMAGLNTAEVTAAVEFIKRLKDYDITVIVVEHIMKAIMSCSDRIIVLNAGAKIAEGLPRDVVKDPEVISAYLGSSYAHT